LEWCIFVIQRSYAKPPPTTSAVAPSATVENDGRYARAPVVARPRRESRVCADERAALKDACDRLEKDKVEGADLHKALLHHALAVDGKLYNENR